MNLKKPSFFFILGNILLTLFILYSLFWGILLWCLFIVIYYFVRRDHFHLPIQNFIKENKEFESFLAPVSGLIAEVKIVDQIIPEIDFKSSNEWYEITIKPQINDWEKEKSLSPFFLSLPREVSNFYWDQADFLWVKLLGIANSQNEYFWISFNLVENNKQNTSFIRLLPGDRLLPGGQLSSSSIDKTFKIYLPSRFWKLLVKEKDNIKLLSTLIAERK